MTMIAEEVSSESIDSNEYTELIDYLNQSDLPIFQLVGNLIEADGGKREFDLKGMSRLIDRHFIEYAKSGQNKFDVPKVHSNHFEKFEMLDSLGRQPGTSFQPGIFEFYDNLPENLRGQLQNYVNAFKNPAGEIYEQKYETDDEIKLLDKVVRSLIEKSVVVMDHIDDARILSYVETMTRQDLMGLRPGFQASSMFNRRTQSQVSKRHIIRAENIEEPHKELDTKEHYTVDEIADIYDRIKINSSLAAIKILDEHFDESQYDNIKFNHRFGGQLELYRNGKLIKTIETLNWGDKLTLISPTEYVEFESKRRLLSIISNFLYISEESDNPSVGEVEDFLSQLEQYDHDPSSYVTNSNDLIDTLRPVGFRANEFFPELIRSIIIKNNISFEKSSLRNKLANNLSDMFSILKSSKLLSFNHDSGEYLKGVSDLVRDMLDVKVTISGNPQQLLRLPSELSVGTESEEGIGSYRLYEQKLTINKIATVSSEKAFINLIDSESDYLYIALPKHAPIVGEVVMYTDQGGDIQTFVEGEDYSLEFNETTGNYRVRFISSVMRSNTRSYGLSYQIGVGEIPSNLIEQELDVQISTDKTLDMIDNLRSLGLIGVADNLQKEIEKHQKRSFIPRIFRIRNNDSTQLSSKVLSKAISDSIYYGFNEKVNPVMRKSIEMFRLSIDSNSSLLDIISSNEHSDEIETMKIAVNCNLIAEFHVSMMNLLLEDQEMTFYSSGLIIDELNGLSSIVGKRYYSSLHADSRAVDSQGKGYKQDLTPGLSIDTLRSVFKKTDDGFGDLVKRIQARVKDGYSDQEILELSISNNPSEFTNRLTNLKIKAYKQAKIEEDEHFDGDFNRLKVNVNSSVAPEEIIDRKMLGVKPLSAMVNVLEYIQKYGLGIHQSAADLEGIEYILDTIISDGRTLLGKNTKESMDLDEMTIEYLYQLRKADPIARQCRDLLNALKTIQT